MAGKKSNPFGLPSVAKPTQVKTAGRGNPLGLPSVAKKSPAKPGKKMSVADAAAGMFGAKSRK